MAKKVELSKMLFKEGFDNTGFSLDLCSELKPFKNTTCELVNAHKIKHQTLFLPISSLFSQSDIKRLANILNKFPF